MSNSLATVAYRAVLDLIEQTEPRVAMAMRRELQDQRTSLKLIASENYASLPVLLTMGSWLSDKYAEGIPGHRFYAGCQNIDEIEALAQSYACKLFDADYAYVQPHSGIDANLVAYWAILSQRVEGPWLAKQRVKNVNELTREDWERLRRELGNQRLLGMALDAGGHLTHGFRPNVSGKMFSQQQYGVDASTGLLNYDLIRRQARAFRPLIIVAGYSAYPRRVNFAKMREIADEVDAVLMVDMAHFAGLVAGNVFVGEENPIPYAHVVTTTHKSLRGPRGGMILATHEYADVIDRGCPLVLGGPLPHLMASKAVALAEASTDDFKRYAQRVVHNAATLAESLLSFDCRLVTGGTDNHLALLDVSAYGLTGRQAETALLAAGIVVNRNALPEDANGPWYTSGIRLGTPALTTRGFGEEEMRETASLIHEILSHTRPTLTASGNVKAKAVTEATVVEQTRRRVDEMLHRHPLYPELDLA